MIQFARSYQDSDGKCWATLEEAQVAELEKLAPDEDLSLTAKFIVGHKDEILAILTLTDSSRPKARGVPKKRKPKVVAAEPVAQPAA